MDNPVQIGDATLYLGDCLEILPTLGKVDAVVTSPPYDQQRQYGLTQFNWRHTVCRAMTFVSSNAQCLVNLGLIYRNGEINQYWDALFSEMRDNGWRLFGWYVWDKGFGLPGNWNGRLAPAHEFIFHFNKEARQANKWVKAGEIRSHGTGLRRADGTMSGLSSPEKCGQPFKIPDSVLRMSPHQARGGPENEHPAIFPTSLPRHLIRTFSDPGEIILDPFMGSGTTGVACAKLGRKFIGIEIEERYFEIACRRIEEAYKQPDLFIAPPEKPKQEALL